MSNPSGTRIPGRNFLFVPGPTNIPDRVLRAMVVAMEDHRSTRFPELANGVLSDLKTVFKTTTGQLFIFPSSGTGAWEAALTNTLSPGDKVVAARFGQFSHLWVDMAQRLGFEVEIVDVEWGEGVPLERIEEILRADKQPHRSRPCSPATTRRRPASRAISARVRTRDGLRATRRCSSSTAVSSTRQHRLSHGRVAASTSPSPARRRA